MRESIKTSSNSLPDETEKRKASERIEEAKHFYKYFLNEYVN